MKWFIEAGCFVQLKSSYLFAVSYTASGPILITNQKINMLDHQNPDAAIAADMQYEVAVLIVECLNLEITADQILPDAPLYGEGLGLDSIDILEVALVVSKRYGFQLRTDSADNKHIFSSLHSLTNYITAQRTR